MRRLHPRRLALLGLCLLLLACERKPQKDRAAADPPTPPRLRPERARPTPRTTPRDAGPAPASRNIAMPLKTSPTWKDLRPLVKAQGLTAPVASSSIVPLGDGRFAAVARVTFSRRGEPTADGITRLDSYDLILLLVEPAGAGWKLAVQYEVFHYALIFDDETDSVPVRITPGDFDQDGRIELELRYRWGETQRGIGWVSRTHVLLVALESAPRIALHETIDATSFDWIETTHLQHVDLNRDGHPDIRIVERKRAVEPRNDDHYKGRKERSYLYDPARDGYLYKGQWMTYPHRPFS